MINLTAVTNFFADQTEFVSSGGNTLVVDAAKTYLSDCTLKDGKGEYVIYHTGEVYLDNTTLKNNAGTGIYSPGGSLGIPNGAASVYVNNSRLDA